MRTTSELKNTLDEVNRIRYCRKVTNLKTCNRSYSKASLEIKMKKNERKDLIYIY